MVAYKFQILFDFFNFFALFICLFNFFSVLYTLNYFGYFYIPLFQGFTKRV